MYYSQSARLALYVQDEFGKSSKTAEGMLRYALNPLVAVIDRSCQGKSVFDVTGIVSNTPIVSTLTEALALKPDALLLGSAWQGGELPAAWRADIRQALEAGLDIISGLHHMLSEDPEFIELATRTGARLLDVRKPPDALPVARARVLETQAQVVLTVGSDCSVGKMTAALEIHRCASKRGLRSKFVATGQTGIMIAGDGIAIDRVIGDFMAGACEQMVLSAAAANDLIVVEGQGSLVHPGFSGVTLALVHGACPQTMIYCHNPSRHEIKSTTMPIPDYQRQIKTYEDMSAYMRPARVVGIALNTRIMSEEEARRAIAEAEAATGLPATDPVRYGADKLLDGIVAVKGIPQSKTQSAGTAPAHKQ